MSLGKDHINYSTEDLNRYLRGEMTAAEMHALEKAALEDPFLTDALEGLESAYASHGTVAVNNSLEQMQESLKNRKLKERGAIYSAGWFKYAAAACFFGVLIIAAFLLIPANQADNELAVTTTEVDQTDSSPSTVLADTQGLFTPQQMTEQNAQDPPQTKPESKIKHPAAEEAKVKTSTNPEQPIVQNEAAAPAADNEERTSTLFKEYAQKMEEVIVVQSPENTNSAKDNFRNTPVHIISGKVVNKNNQPLPNASVSMLNRSHNAQENIRMITDMNGNFKVKTPDTLLKVQVDLAGYRETDYLIKRSSNTNQIILEPERLSRARRTISKATGTQHDSLTLKNFNAEPITGWSEFESYLQENKTPVKKNWPSGEVIISFVVLPGGKLTNFKVEKSVFSELDQDVIQLIKNGPSWKLKTPMPSPIQISVVY